MGQPVPYTGEGKPTCLWEEKAVTRSYSEKAIPDVYRKKERSHIYTGRRQAHMYTGDDSDPSRIQEEWAVRLVYREKAVAAQYRNKGRSPPCRQGEGNKCRIQEKGDQCRHNGQSRVYTVEPSSQPVKGRVGDPTCIQGETKP